MARSIFAALVVAIILGAGAYFVLGLAPDRHAEDFIRLVLLHDGFSICTVAGWASLAAAFLAITLAWGLFGDPPETRGRGIGQRPYGLPVFFALVSLALFWASFACMEAARSAGEPMPEPEPALLGGPAAPAPPEPLPPEPEPEPAAPPPPPQVAVYETPLAWRYADPAVLNGDWRQSARMRGELSALFPRADPGGRVRALLCGKAWVALSGAASQEGPRDRNERRARLRAELAAAEARGWLAAQGSDCARPVLLGLDLGQHADVGLVRGDGADTARQRALLIVYRERAYAGETVSEAQAAAELRAFLAAPANRSRLLEGRVYAGEPEVFIADGR